MDEWKSKLVGAVLASLLGLMMKMLWDVNAKSVVHEAQIEQLRSVQHTIPRWVEHRFSEHKKKHE